MSLTDETFSDNKWRRYVRKSVTVMTNKCRRYKWIVRSTLF